MKSLFKIKREKVIESCKKGIKHIEEKNAEILDSLAFQAAKKHLRCRLGLVSVERQKMKLLESFRKMNFHPYSYAYLIYTSYERQSLSDFEYVELLRAAEASEGEYCYLSKEDTNLIENHIEREGA